MCCCCWLLIVVRENLLANAESERERERLFTFLNLFMRSQFVIVTQIKYNDNTLLCLCKVGACSGFVIGPLIAEKMTLLHFVWLVRRTNKSGGSNKSRPPRSNCTVISVSTMLLRSRNIFEHLLDHSTSWEIVIFCFKFFIQSMQCQRRSYSQCQPSNIVMSITNTPSYTIQRRKRKDAAKCNNVFRYTSNLSSFNAKRKYYSTHHSQSIMIQWTHFHLHSSSSPNLLPNSLHRFIE